MWGGGGCRCSPDVQRPNDACNVRRRIVSHTSNPDSDYGAIFGGIVYIWEQDMWPKALITENRDKKL